MTDRAGRQMPGEPRGSLSLRRAALAAKLQEAAAALSREYRKLTRSRAEQTVMIFWRQGLEEVWGHVVKVQRLMDDWESLYEDEVAAGAEAGPQAEQQDDADTRPEAFRQLDEAATLAVRDYNAARHSLEIADQPELQSDLFMRAVGNLAELGAHCDALAVHMRGPEGLADGVQP
jgi:hypothetical protein